MKTAKPSPKAGTYGDYVEMQRRSEKVNNAIAKDAKRQKRIAAFERAFRPSPGAVAKLMATNPQGSKFTDVKLSDSGTLPHGKLSFKVSVDGRRSRGTWTVKEAFPGASISSGVLSMAGGKFEVKRQFTGSPDDIVGLALFYTATKGSKR